MQIFIFDNATNTLQIDDYSILLIKEFAKLWEPERNKCKEDKTGTEHLRADREFTYIYLAIAWKSPYANYAEQERHQAALQDANMTEDEFNDPTFRAACRKFRAL